MISRPLWTQARVPGIRHGHKGLRPSLDGSELDCRDLGTSFSIDGLDGYGHGCGDLEMSFGF